MDGYKEAHRRFYDTYRPIQKRYGLRMHSHFSVNGDGLIEIWEYRGEVRGKRIVWVKEETDTKCYKRAAEELESYKNDKEEEEVKKIAELAAG